MKEVKEDIRITKTKRDLGKALADLLVEVPFEKITVSDICARALVNRMTFYKHYADKYALLGEIMNTLRNEIYLRHCARYGENQSLRDFCVTIMNEIFETCFDNQTILRALTRQGNTVVVDVISKTLQDGIFDLVTEVDRRAPVKYPIPFVTAIICGGASNAIWHWLTHPSLCDRVKFVEGANRLMADIIDSGIFFRAAG